MFSRVFGARDPSTSEQATERQLDFGLSGMQAKRQMTDVEAANAVAPRKNGASGFDILLYFCRLINVITGISALLCLVAHAMAIVIGPTFAVRGAASCVSHAAQPGCNLAAADSVPFYLYPPSPLFCVDAGNGVLETPDASSVWRASVGAAAPG